MLELFYATDDFFKVTDDDDDVFFRLAVVVAECSSEKECLQTNQILIIL